MNAYIEAIEVGTLLCNTSVVSSYLDLTANNQRHQRLAILSIVSFFIYLVSYFYVCLVFLIVK